MSNLECQEMMNNLIANEEKRLNVNSQEFLEKHLEIMDLINKQLNRDLMMEQRETM
jgi:hypothetical protein